METTYSIQGYVVGEIWLPFQECYKPLSFSFVRNEADRPNPWVDAHETLREAMLKATSDGDFRHCKVADGVLSLKRTTRTKTGQRTHERTWELSSFPSIADMVKLDWNGPDLAECEDI